MNLLWLFWLWIGWLNHQFVLELRFLKDLGIFCLGYNISHIKNQMIRAKVSRLVVLGLDTNSKVLCSQCWQTTKKTRTPFHWILVGEWRDPYFMVYEIIPIYLDSGIKTHLIFERKSTQKTRHTFGPLAKVFGCLGENTYSKKTPWP